MWWPVARRRYDNSERSRRAGETTDRVLRTALRLLLADGYQAMTVASLAAAAGVSPQTVYNSVGGKAAVVKGVYDTLLGAGTSPEPMSARREFRAISQEDDPERMLRAYARHCRTLHERVGPFLGVLLAHGPGGDPVLEDFVATIERERRTGNGHMLDALVERHGLRPGQSPHRAGDVVWTVTPPQVGDRHVRRSGWSPRAYEEWLADVLIASLLDRSR
jgi:AcrR family transcriptional regulator